MFRQFATGATISVCNICVHALVMTIVVRVAHAAHSARAASHPALLLVSVMSATVVVLMCAHVCEVAIWSLAYAIFDVLRGGGNHLYFAFVNYTTLGYGDIIPNERWLLLGPMTAMNGVLLFGWSTAVIFEVLRNALVATEHVSRVRNNQSGPSENA